MLPSENYMPLWKIMAEPFFGEENKTFVGFNHQLSRKIFLSFEGKRHLIGSIAENSSLFCLGDSNLIEIKRAMKMREFLTRDWNFGLEWGPRSLTKTPVEQADH